MASAWRCLMRSRMLLSGLISILCPLPSLSRAAVSAWVQGKNGRPLVHEAHPQQADRKGAGSAWEACSTRQPAAPRRMRCVSAASSSMVPGEPPGEAEPPLAPDTSASLSPPPLPPSSSSAGRQFVAVQPRDASHHHLLRLCCCAAGTRSNAISAHLPSRPPRLPAPAACGAHTAAPARPPHQSNPPPADKPQG